MDKYFLLSLFLCLSLMQAHGANPVKHSADATDIPAWDTTGTTFVISNEKGAASLEGGLIDCLIKQGYGDSSMFAVMQYLQPLSGGAIPQLFMDSLAVCPAGSEIFTEPLITFNSETNNPVGISTDGILLVIGISGRDYYTKEGYETFSDKSTDLGKVRFTSAASSLYYINTGISTSTYEGGKIDSTGYYYVFAIAWSDSATTVNSVNNISADELRIFPNPASDKVTVSINNARTHSELTLYDAFGRLVMKKQISSDQQLDVSALAEGIYYISIRKGDKVKPETGKLVIGR